MCHRQILLMTQDLRARNKVLYFINEMSVMPIYINSHPSQLVLRASDWSGLSDYEPVLLANIAESY